MAASKKKRTGARAAVVVVLCLVLVCVVAAAVALGLVSRRVKSFAGGASFSLDYQITSTAAEEPALYKVLAQFGGTSGRVDGQYTPEALQLELYPQASGSSQPLTRLYISKDETLYDAGQLYRTLRSSITDNYPLAGVLIPEWNMGSYISQTQLASLLGVDDTATSLQSMNDFQLDLKKIKKVQPENAKEGYLYFRLETDDTAADSPVLTLGVEKSGLLRAASPAVHILLDIPAHGIHTELTGTVTPAAPTLTAPTSRMQDSDIASLVQLRQTVESVVLRGTVHIENLDLWGSKSILSSISAGQAFAETYALCGDVMMVDAVAAEECEVLFVNISAFSGGAPGTVHEKLLRNLLTVSMRKNLSLSQRIFCTTPKTVRGRLLTYFSAQAARSGSLQFEIPFNRQQLADYLNLDRSALSKELCKMRDEGLLTFEKNRFALNELPE